MGLFSYTKKPMGKLRVDLEYQTKYNFSMTVTIRELKLTEPITYEGKLFELPAGSYTVSLKGLMSDPNYGGDYHASYQGVYGTFERRQMVEVNPNRQTVLRFDLPGERVPVTIHVVAGEVPVVGAEVLIREVDSNFRVTRKGEGVQFYLEPGTYAVVATRGEALIKEAIHVTPQDTKFILDLSKQMALRAGLVVVRYLDGNMVKGSTEDFAPGVSRFTVAQKDGTRIPIEGFAGIKAVFFVKTLEGNRSYDEHKDFALASQFGIRTVVVFADKEEMRGYTLPGETEKPQFFLFPVDRKSNNAKIYVIREATTDIQFT